MVNSNSTNGAIPQSNGSNPVHEAHVEHDAEMYPAAEKLEVRYTSHFHRIETAKITPKISPATKELILDMGRFYEEQMPPLSGYFKLDLRRLTIQFEACILWGILGRDGEHTSLHETGAGFIAAFLRDVQYFMETAKAEHVDIRVTVKLMGNERIPTPDRAPILNQPILDGFTFEDDDGNTFVALPEVPRLRCVIFI